MAVVIAAVAGWLLFGGPDVWSSAEAAAAQSAPAMEPTPAIRAEGRVSTYPGDQVHLGTELGGTITRLHVREGETVKKGDILVEFDDTTLRAALGEAKAGVHAHNARAGFHVKETQRLKTLSDSGAVPPRELDRAKSERNATFAETAVALSTVKRIEADLAKTVLRAPIDGTIIACSVEQGETLPPMAQLLTIANLDRLRIVAEVDEFDAARVELGSEATITAEGLDTSWDAKVEEVPGALVPKGLKPRDPARPVDTRVLLVKLGLLQPTPLKLGQRVEVRIHLPPTHASEGR